MRLFSAPFRLTEKGQFVPLTSMVLLTSVLLMIVGVNIYRISKNKLQVQNMADAAALAVASLEATAVNTPTDRNEWMNNFYTKEYKHNSNSLPNISDAYKYKFHDDDNGSQEARDYANLVGTINKAQRMFVTAYNNFLGVGDNTASGGSGTAALADILNEIDGLQDQDIIAVWVYNDEHKKPSDQMLSNIGAQTMSIGNKVIPGGMTALKFVMEDVPVHTKKDGWTSLTKLAGGDPNIEAQRVGWMHPDWTDNQMSVQVSKNGGSEHHWGVGVTIVKRVSLYVFGMTTVRATAQAYVVDGAGTASAKDVTRPAVGHFRPTFYARLAYHS